MWYARDDTRGMKAGQIQNLDFLQHESGASIEPPGRYLFRPEVLVLTIRFRAFTSCHHRQTGGGPEPSTVSISIVLLFRPEADVILNLATKYTPEIVVSNNTTTLFLHSVWLGYEDRVQEAVRWDEKSVVFAWLQCEDLLADRTCIQAILAPQMI